MFSLFLDEFFRLKMTLFIGNVSRNVKSEEIQREFENYGVCSVKKMVSSFSFFWDPFIYFFRECWRTPAKFILFELNSGWRNNSNDIVILCFLKHL